MDERDSHCLIVIMFTPPPTNNDGRAAADHLRTGADLYTRDNPLTIFH